MKSSFCASNSCVDVDRVGDMIHITNTADPKQPVLKYTLEEWRAFVKGVKNFEFDIIASEEDHEGSNSLYVQGCTGPKCAAAHREYQREWSQKNGRAAGYSRAKLTR